MASTPKMEYQVFLCIFRKNPVMATLGLKEMGIFKVCLENSKNSGIMKSGLDPMPLFLLDDLLSIICCIFGGGCEFLFFIDEY